MDQPFDDRKPKSVTSPHQRLVRRRLRQLGVFHSDSRSDGVDAARFLDCDSAIAGAQHCSHCYVVGNGRSTLRTLPAARRKSRRSQYLSAEGEWPVSYHGTSYHNGLSIAAEVFQLSKSKRFKFGKGIYSTTGRTDEKLKYNSANAFQIFLFHSLIPSAKHPKP